MEGAVSEAHTRLRRAHTLAKSTNPIWVALYWVREHDPLVFPINRVNSINKWIQLWGWRGGMRTVWKQNQWVILFFLAEMFS